MVKEYPSMDMRRDVLIVQEDELGDDRARRVHKRLGVITLRYRNPARAASKHLLQILGRAGDSLNSRLNDNAPGSVRRTYCNEVYTDFERTPWPVCMLELI
jgi:hypothetical protein